MKIHVIHVIVVAYQRYEPLEILIRSFLIQTNPNWVLHIIHDGPSPQRILDIIGIFIDGARKDERIHFYESKERYEKYGHPNRRSMLQEIQADQKDFILMTNDDNYYICRFVEFFLKEVRPNTGMVYCNTLHSLTEYVIHNSTIGQGGIDMGAFIVRADVAKETGFNHDDAQADGFYAGECLARCQRKGLIAVKIEKALFVHN